MRIVFIGTGDIGLPSLRHLAGLTEHTICGVVTQPDRPAGRQMKPQASPVKGEALKLHLPVFQPENINLSTAISQLRYMKADVFVVAAYGQILKKTVLELPQLGCLNIHASLLPKYRGASPIQSALRNRDRYSGVTIMWMDEGLDTGDILMVRRTVIRPDDTAETLHDRLADLAPSVLQKSLALMAKGKAPRLPQNAEEATVVKRLKKEDGHVDWNQTQRMVDAHIRAMIPWPGAYAWLPVGHDHKMLKIFSTILSNRCKGKPGEVMRVDHHGILVAAKSGGLLLREVQMEGKRRMHAAEFARGFNLPLGTVLE